MTKGKSILFYSALIIVGTYFFFLGIVKAKGFLAPLATAVILALLILPLAQKMEHGFFNRTASSLTNTFILFLISIGFMALFSFQAKSFVDDWPRVQETMKPKVEQLKSFVLQHTPLEKKDIESPKQGNSFPFLGSGSESTKKPEKVVSFFSSVIGLFGDYLLTFIYVFFLLNYRRRFKKFLLLLFPDEKRQKMKNVIHQSAKVAQQYLAGKLFLILFLAVLYAIGLGISGVKNFIMISALAALFSLIPYIGNIIGFGMAMAFGLLSSGDSSMFIGIVITFTVAQFVESYILEPYLVGDKVDLHPFFVILVVIIGNMLWGIIGMILAIPILGILNVILLHIGPLKPFGFLISKKKIPDG